jgi:dTDP-4-dehydrorhamnose 3,5-epimerase
VLSAKKPSILEIPAGFANGFMTLTPDTIVCFFSSATLDESAADDIRFPARLWDPWAVEER